MYNECKSFTIVKPYYKLQNTEIETPTAQRNFYAKCRQITDEIMKAVETNYSTPRKFIF